jgi:hypothetical protein
VGELLGVVVGVMGTVVVVVVGMLGVVVVTKADGDESS